MFAQTLTDNDWELIDFLCETINSIQSNEPNPNRWLGFDQLMGIMLLRELKVHGYTVRRNEDAIESSPF